MTSAARPPAGTALPPGQTGVKSRVASISDLLRKAPNRYAIPLYQREFSWQETQIEALLEDLNVVQERRSAGDTYRRFFGTVYIQNDVAQQVDWVLDGQQRLTTFQLILLAIEDIMGHHGSDNLFDGLDTSRLKAVKDMLGEGLIHNHSGQLLLEAEFESDAQKHIFSAALGSRNTEAESFGDANRAAKVYCDGFSTAYKWLYERIRAHSLRLDFIEHFVHGLFESEVIVANLDTSANVFQIFDGLNSRGKPLETHERVKNILLSAVFGDPAKQLNFKDRWGQLCTDFRSGLQLDFDTVLQYYAILTREEDVQPRNVVEVCEKAILSGISGPDDFLTYVEKLVKRLREISNKKIEQRIDARKKKAIERILGRIVDLKASYSLLPLFAVEGDRWGSDSTAKLCTYIEHFTFRCMTVKSGGLDKFKKIIIPHSIDLRDASDSGSLPSAVEAFRTAALDACPDNDLRSNFEVRSESNSSIQRYVLLKFAQAWDPADPLYPADSHVEHIYPKTPISKTGKDYWPHLQGKPGFHYLNESKGQKDARFKTTHKFGNLILLAEAWNIRLSNLGPDEKFRRGYLLQTETPMLKELIALASSRHSPLKVVYNWDGSLIDKRQRAMATDAPDVWYLSKKDPIAPGKAKDEWRKKAAGLALQRDAE